MGWLDFCPVAGALDLPAWCGDASGSREFFNTPWLALTGCRVAPTGRAWLEWIHPEDRDAVARCIAEAASLQSPFRLQYRLRRGDGTYVAVMDAGSPRPGPGGGAEAYSGVTTDLCGAGILSAGQPPALTPGVRGIVQGLEAVLDACPLALIGIAADRTVISWNRAAEALYGWKETETLGRPYPVVPAGHETQHAGFADHVLAGNLLFAQEIRRRRKDGSMVDVCLWAAPIRDSGGAVIGAMTIHQDITARRRAAQNVPELENLVENLLELAPALIFARSPDGRYLLVNSAWERATGFSREQALGRLLTELWPPEAAAALAESDRTVLETGAPVETEDILAFPEGERNLSFIKFPLRDSSGQINAVGGIATDVTAHHTAAEALRLSEERYRLLIEASPIGVVVTSIADDDLGRVISVNDAFQRMVGYSREEMAPGRAFWRSISPPDHGKRDLLAVEQARRTGASAPYERQYIRKDGSLAYVLVALSAIGAARREVVAFVLDITERKASQRALEESRERLQLALDAASDGLWDWNVQTNRVYFSPRYHAMLGYEPGEIAADYSGWATLVHPEDLAVALEAIARAQSGEDGSQFQAEFRMRRKTGEYAWILGRGKVVERAPDGGVVRMVGTHTDITERKRLEEQFLQVQKLETVGRLAGGVAHDFNNLLTVINGYCELLLARAPAGDPSRTSLEEIRGAGAKAAALTQQLLAFSRRQVARPQVLDLSRLISGMENMLRRLIGDDIELVMDLSREPCTVQADATQWNQVVLNLAVNARDAMRGGGVLLIETTRMHISEAGAARDPELTPGDYVALSVSDNGVGMTEEVKGHLFEPFFTTKPVGAGTGLGLSTVYGIVRQAGGWIRVFSETGKGSTFRILLPLLPGEQEAPETLAADPERDLRGSETVLLVEDQPEVRRLAAEVLDQYGYRVLESPGPEHALELCRQHSEPIQLLVTDVVMPVMNGGQLATEIRNAYPGIRTLFISGYDEQVVAQSLAEQSGTAHLQKPFTPEALAAKVRDVLGIKSRGRILVVDDEAPIRTFVREVLHEAGFVVQEAANGAEAMQQLEHHPADVMITDLAMPNQEGLATIRMVRQSHPNTRIIAMTGAFGSDILKTARLLGAHATLTKPVSMDDITTTVTRLLNL